MAFQTVVTVPTYLPSESYTCEMANCYLMGLLKMSEACLVISSAAILIIETNGGRKKKKKDNMTLQLKQLQQIMDY